MATGSAASPSAAAVGASGIPSSTAAAISGGVARRGAGRRRKERVDLRRRHHRAVQHEHRPMVVDIHPAPGQRVALRAPVGEVGDRLAAIEGAVGDPGAIDTGGGVGAGHQRLERGGVAAAVGGGDGGARGLGAQGRAHARKALGPGADQRQVGPDRAVLPGVGEGMRDPQPAGVDGLGQPGEIEHVEALAERAAGMHDHQRIRGVVGPLFDAERRVHQRRRIVDDGCRRLRALGGDQRFHLGRERGVVGGQRQCPLVIRQRVADEAGAPVGPGPAGKSGGAVGRGVEGGVEIGDRAAVGLDRDPGLAAGRQRGERCPDPASVRARSRRRRGPGGSGSGGSGRAAGRRRGGPDRSRSLRRAPTGRRGSRAARAAASAVSRPGACCARAGAPASSARAQAAVAMVKILDLRVTCISVLTWFGVVSRAESAPRATHASMA